MYCYQPCLSESLYQEIHQGKFASSLSGHYHQFIGVKERSIEFFVIDEKNPTMKCFKVIEKDLFLKVKSSGILRRSNSVSHSKNSDLVVLSLENDTLVLLEYHESEEGFEVATYAEIALLNAQKAPIEKVGDRIKIVDDLILLCSYYNMIEVYKYEDSPPRLEHKSSIKAGQFISDLDFCRATSTLSLLCHSQGEGGQINMNIQFYTKEKDRFKFETALEKTDLMAENISYKISANTAQKCLTVSPVDGLTAWSVNSLKKDTPHKLESETVIDIFALNDILLLFLDDNSCLYFESIERLSEPTKIQISTNQKAISWTVFSGSNDVIYALLNGHTGLEFYKCHVIDGYLQRMECVLKENSYSNVVDSQFFPFSPINQSIVSLSLKPESLDYNIWDSLSETYFGGQLFRVVSETLKVPLTPLRSWILNASESVKILLLQTLQEVYALVLENLLQENFRIRLENLSTVFAGTKIESLISAFNLNSRYGILATPSEVYLVNFETFAAKNLGFSGKIDLVSSLEDETNFVILINSRDQVLCYTLDKNEPEVFQQQAQIGVSSQVSCMHYFHQGNNYLATFNYNSEMIVYDIKTQVKVFETQLEHVIGDAYFRDGKLILGDRRGNVLIYQTSLDENGFSMRSEARYNIGEQKISLRPVNKHRGLLIYSENLYFMGFDDNKLEPYPVKFSDPLNTEFVHLLDEAGPHLLVVEKSEIKFFLADLKKSYRKNDFPLENYLDSFKMKNEPDQIRRILIDESTSTINLLTRNLRVITCDKNGRILSVKSIPNKKNTYNSTLVNAKTSTITIQEKPVSFFMVSFKSANSYYLNFYNIEKTSDLSTDASTTSIKVRKLGTSDVSSPDIITDAVILDNEKVMIASIGATLSLYNLELKERDEEVCLYFKPKESKVFRYNFIQMEVLNDLLIASDQNFGVNIFKLEKHSLGESLGYKLDFVIKCVISNRMPCDAAFLSKDEYLVINKLGELSVRHNRYTDYFHHCLEYSQGNIGDMCRKMLLKRNEGSEKASEVFIPGLKGGLFKTKKVSQTPDKNVLQALKFIESCYKDILLYGEPINVADKLASSENYSMLDWKVLSTLRKEPEQTRTKILSNCISLLPIEKNISLINANKILEKFC